MVSNNTRKRDPVLSQKKQIIYLTIDMQFLMVEGKVLQELGGRYPTTVAYPPNYTIPANQLRLMYQLDA